MVLDGYTVKPKDLVYCLLNGRGKVLNIAPNFVVVEFKGKGKRRYSLTGHYGMEEAKTLYWHDPVMVVPPKSKERYAFIVDLILAVMKTIKTHS